SVPRRRQWPRRTTHRTGCPPGCGPRRAAGSSGWRSGCGPAWCGPTPTTGSTRPARSAGTGSRGLAGKAAARDWPGTSMPERKNGKAASAAKTSAAKNGSRGKTASGGKAASRGKAVSLGTATSPAKAPGPARTASPAKRGRPAQAGPRLGVRKTYKLFVGGAFPRSESGRTYPVTGPDGTLLAHAALASRKDARDAVSAARKALPGWSGATAYNRGQVLYRVAELLEGRAEQFAAEFVKAAGVSPGEAESVVAGAIDRWVWYAGWPDKIGQVDGAANPVAGPYFNLSVPEP